MGKVIGQLHAQVDVSRKWTRNDELQLGEARAFVADAEARRNAALQKVADAMLAAGVEGWCTEDVVKCADIIRDALEPFDSGARCANAQS